MINRSRHTRRKQTLSTPFQLEVTSDRPRLTRSLSAETDISTLHKNPATVTLGGNRLTSLPSSLHTWRIQTCQLCATVTLGANGLTSLPSSLHTWRIQTCQLCAKTVSAHPAATDIVNFVPSGQNNGMINRSRRIRRKQTLSTLFQLEVTRGRELRNHIFSINSFSKLLFFVAARAPPPAANSKTSIFQ